jgi:hypothetical protein
MNLFDLSCSRIKIISGRHDEEYLQTASDQAADTDAGF